MGDVKESEILERVAALQDIDARAAWNKVKSEFGQNPFKGRNERERRESFFKLFESAKTTPVAFRLGLINARRQDFHADMIEAAMKQNVPEADCEDFINDFKKAQNYPGAIPDALEALGAFDAGAAEVLLARARALWPELNPKDTVNDSTTEATVQR